MRCFLPERMAQRSWSLSSRSKTSRSCWRASRSMSDVFFFSSRRRHTRLQGDWSSDVCSSDLHPFPVEVGGLLDAAIRALHHVAVAKTAVREHRDGGKRLGVVASDQVGDERKRSEERRVGEEGRSRGVPDHLKKKKKHTIDRGM